MDETSRNVLLAAAASVIVIALGIIIGKLIYKNSKNAG